MPFIEQNDYLPQIRQDIKAVITDGDQAILLKAELEAETEAASYLRKRFDTAQIFSKTGSDRNQHLVMLLVDITLYHIHARISPRNVPEIREIRYTNAIDWLRAAANGDVTPDLPLIQDSDGQAIVPLRTGSNPKLEHYY